MKKIILILLLFGFNGEFYSQNKTIDSLKLALKNAKHDTTRCNILSALVYAIDDDNIWTVYNDQLLELSKKNSTTKSPSGLNYFYLKCQSNALNSKGYLAKKIGDSPTALFFFNKSLDIRKKIKNKELIAISLNNLGSVYDYMFEMEKAIEYYNQSLQIKEEINDKKGMLISLNNIGIIYKRIGNYQKSLACYHRSLKVAKEINNKVEFCKSLLGIGTLYNDQGKITNALDCFYQALKISEEIQDKNLMANSLNNIGVIYENQRDLPKALEYYNKGLLLSESVADKIGVANSLKYIGNIYTQHHNFKEALSYSVKSLHIYENIKYKKGISEVSIVIGDIYINMIEYDSAFFYYNKSLKIEKEIQNNSNIVKPLSGIAIVMFKKEQLNEAIKYAQNSLKLSKLYRISESTRTSARILKQIYQKQNKFKDAFEMYELEIQMRDSINNQETKKASIKKQFQYQYEKKAAADSVKNTEQQKVKNALLTAQQAQLKQEKTKSYALYGGLALVLVFAGFMFNRFRVTSKQKVIIELKEIETQKQNAVITQQKHLVEEKHREITDSINYAERIQRSFLATKEQLDEKLKDYFVLFQPKDVVSGDFYWAHSLHNGNFALVTADSTGHGVPGAIMSLLNTSSLEKAVELGINEPSEILNNTRVTIIERLKKDGSAEGGKDGMDCSLISFNKDKTKLTYAAANNPIWIIRSLSPLEGGDRRSGDVELIELSPDKIPVGKHDRDSVSFTQHEVELQKGDMIYTLTDGFPDQFGGPKGKKFMYKKLKDLLMSIAHKPTIEQQTVLKDTLKDWMGNTEQVDDITVIGVRI